MRMQPLGRIKLLRRPLFERRAEPREPVSIRGTASCRGVTFPVHLRDLSQRGGAVVVDGGFQPDGHERILLTLPQPTGTLRIQAEVRHGRPTSREGRRAYEVGVEFSRVARVVRG